MKRVISFILTLAVCAGMFITLKPGYAQAATKKPGKPSITVTSGKDGTSVKITVKKTEGADGFYVYMKSAYDAKFTKVKSIKKDGTAERSCTVDKLTSGKTYAFKVKAYLKAGSKTVTGKYSKARIITPTKASKSSKFAPVKEYDYIEQIPYYADNAYDVKDLPDTIKVGDSISFTKTIKINGEKGNAVFDLTDTDALKYLKENDPDEYEYLYNLEIKYWDDPNYYKIYNELANIPILSEANKKGLEDGYTILGTKTEEEEDKLLALWEKTTHIYDLNFQITSVWAYNDGIANGSVIANENTLIVGDSSFWINDETFSEKVYEVYIWIPSLVKVKNGKLHLWRYSSVYMECITTLSFITSYPYEVATAIIGTDRKTGLWGNSSMRNKWIRVNDVLIYINSEGDMYMKPVD